MTNIIKDCPIGKILNIETNRCVNINGKIGKEIIKNLTLKPAIKKDAKKPLVKEDSIIDKKYKSLIVKDKSNKIYLIVNKSIIADLDKNDVILDPAGLGFMQNSFAGAGFASDAIYQLLSTNKPNKDVIKHFTQFKDEEYLYEKNKDNISIAYYSAYNNGDIKIIHAIGPNFSSSSALKKIIKSDDLAKLHKLIYKVYKDIYKSFIKEYKKNKKLHLRLLPVSTGVFINNDKDSKIKIFKCLKIIYQELNTKYKIHPVIYFYAKEDYELFTKIIIT